MKQNYWKQVNNVIRQSDIIFEVLDARMPEQTINEEVEKKVKKAGKILIRVFNKSDLIDFDMIREQTQKYYPCVHVSSKDRLGTKKLRDFVHVTARKNKIARYIDYDKIVVGIVGYPNVGKSSLINVLRGRTSAPVSPISGFTRTTKTVNIDNTITLIDTPGVLPYKEKNELKHVMIGTIDYNRIKEPDITAMQLLEHHKEAILKHFDMDPEECAELDEEETLEKMALKKKFLLKAGKPDITRMAVSIIREWQTGKIKQV